MKKLLIPLAFFLISTSSNAQNERNPFPKTITVSGSAETEVVPDEIFVQVILREYEKKGKGKVDIETIKKDFLTHVKRIGIPDSLISIAAYDGLNEHPWWRKRNRRDELYASISYEIKLKSSRQVDDLVNGLDDDATQDFFIQRTSFSKIAELRKQLKIAAVRSAKEKAEYLSAAINEKVGEAVNINEPNEYYVPYYNVRRSNVMMKEGNVSADMAAPAEPLDFRKIKLRYDVTVVFALK
ncbi:MAG: SIMPL domain-containing protein [Chitinophagaceae bacterium]